MAKPKIIKKVKSKNLTWDLTKLFAGDDDIRMAADLLLVKEKSYAFIGKWKDREDYLNDPVVLAEAMAEYESWAGECAADGDSGYYWWLRSSQEEDNPNVKAKVNKIQEFSTQIINDIQFFELRVAKIPEERQQEFLNFPGMQPYRHMLEKLFAEAKYQLSEAEEKIVNLYSPMAKSNWVKMVSAFISKEERKIKVRGKSQKKGFEELLALLSDKDKQTRDAAAQAVHDICKANLAAAENELNTVLQVKKVGDELRKIPRPDLGRHLADDIDSAAVDTLIETVQSTNGIAHQYYRLKSQLLGQDKLDYHERNVVIGEVEKEYSYEEAVKTVQTVMQKLDPEFGAIFAKFASEGHIDVFPRKGKHGGAFCAYNLPSQPVYILLNYTDKLRDVLTIAHESGHGINDELIRQAQNALNADTPMSTAEVASTFFEDFVFEHLLADVDDETRLSLLMSKLGDQISTIHRQVACYTFEQELHQSYREQGYLSSVEIGKLFQKHMSAYMGEFVEQSVGSENWWVYWSHIRSYFYVYSYASGLLISQSLQAQVRKDPKFIQKVKSFLSAGTSASPRDIFANLGIDITDKKFWLQGLGEMENLLAETEKLARKLGRVK